MPSQVGPISVAQLSVIEARVPTWATTTTIYRDAEGNVVGFGRADRASGTFELRPGGVRTVESDLIAAVRDYAAQHAPDWTGAVLTVFLPDRAEPVVLDVSPVAAHPAPRL